MTKSYKNFEAIDFVSREGLLNAQNTNLLSIVLNSFGLYIY